MNPPPVFLAPLLEPSRFEEGVNGKPVRLFTIRNAGGMAVDMTNYGARIEQILAPDRQERIDDVVLGYDSLKSVMTGAPSMGLLWAAMRGALKMPVLRWTELPVAWAPTMARTAFMAQCGARGSRSSMRSRQVPQASKCVMSSPVGNRVSQARWRCG